MAACREPVVVGWPAIRHAVVFLLGCGVILDALVSPGDPWPQLVVGAVMVGVLPLDRLVVGMRPVNGRGRGRGRGPTDPPDRNASRR